MAKQLNVNLAFTADTGQAKQQIQALQQDLKNLVSATGATKDFKLTKDLAEAKEAAGQLGLALKNATTSTGSLDLSKFDQALKASGMTLAEYRTKLSSMGPAGQQAFAKVAQSIVQAEVPLKRTSTLLDKFKTTLVNTARWQLSSSMLHGFMGALQSAYGYAQDLNSSLNNIRIITGATTDEMAVFADQANKAAQVLSTSTTSYTDAALIYYQQGIRDQEEIAERTETTIKMANVSRQSAEDVSQQMTAIWNNFDDGSKALEYYADGITALGATTASSSQEIATGLEKFSAIAKTVGLSFEYATAAMATITAQTRQSADTVGTGLRTIFSRLESLNLGETLEDGVDLNKYSKALDEVGVKVLDANGNLRQMDDILDDLGSRWDDLNQAQKIALAQTVGGVRQYTNLIALMDNWDKMQENVLTAKNSEGTLQKQADIYAESWEAAQKRVRAAAQALYQDLLDDDFFITLTNGFANILKAIDDLIDGIGGLRTILPGAALLLTNMFGSQMANSIDNTIFNMMRGTEQMKAFYDTKKQEAMQEASMLYTNPNSMGDQAAQAGLERQLDLTYQLEDVANILSEEEIERLQTSIDTVASLNEQAEAMGRIADASKKSLQDQKASIIGSAALNAGANKDDRRAAAGEAAKQLETIDKTVKPIAEAKVQLQGLIKEFDKGNIDAFDQGLIDIQDSLNGMSNSFPFVKKAYDEFIESGGENIDLARELAESTTLDEQAYLDVAEALDEYDQIVPEVNDNLQKYIQNSAHSAEDIARSAQGINAAGDAASETEKKIQQAGETANQQLGTTGQVFVSVFQGISQVTMGMSALSNVLETLQSPDASGWEKFKAVLLGVSLGLPMIISGASTLVGVFTKLQAAVTAEMLAMEANTGATQANALVKGIAAIMTGKLTLAEVAHNVVKAISNTLTTIGTALMGAYEAAVILVSGALATGITMQTAFNVAMAANPVGVVIVAITALIAVIFALAAGIKGLINLWNAHNITAENAATAAANLQQQFQDTKQAYDDLKSSIEDYQSAYNAIGQLQKGTQEWKDAIRDSNTQALELISTLGLMKDQDYQIGKDGEITFTSKGQEKIDNKVAEKSAEVDNAQMSALMGEVTAKQAQAEADLVELKRSTGQRDEVIDNAIKQLTSGDLAEAFKRNALSDEDLKQKLHIDDSDLINSIKELATTINQNTDMQQMAAEESAKVALENNEEVQKSGYAEDITKAAGNIYGQAYESSYDKYADSLKLGISNTVFDQFAKLSGLDQLKGFENEGGGKYSYIDESGQKQKAEVTAEEIAMTLAAAEAQQQLSDVASSLVGELKNLDSAATASSEGLKKFLTDRDLNSAKKSELESLSKETNDGKDTDKYLGESLGDKNGELTDKEAQNLGYDSAQAMIEAFNQGLSDAQSNIADAGKDLIPSFMEKAFDAVSENSDLGISGKTAIASAIDSALASGGNDAAKKLMNQFMEASEAGELTDEAIQKITADAEKLNTVDLSTLTEQIAKVNSILNGLETGDSISADDYNALSEEQQSYFAMAMDGTYQLIGSAEELRDITSEANFEKFKQMGDEAANTANTYNTAGDIAETQGIDALSESAYLEGGGPKGAFTFDASLLETQLGLIKECQGELDISNAKLAEWQEQFAQGTVDPNMLKDVADAVGQLNLSEESLAQGAEESAEKQQEFQTALALSAEDTNELQQMLEDGDIGPEAFNKGLEKLHNTLDEDIDTEQYEELAEYFEEFGDEIKGVSKDMKGNKKASRELAKEISRFDAAVESVGENYNDWMSDLKKGEKNSTTHAKTIKGLRNAYGDLLDVSGDTLSKNFLENTKNLEDMAAAADGDEEAYNRLARAARQDIAIQAGFDDAEFQSGFQDLMNKYYEGQNLDDLEVGASLNDEGFLQGLTDLVNAAGMTAQQATDYLASMGMDATVEEDTTTDTETNEVSGYRMHPQVARSSGTIDMVSGSGENMTVIPRTITASMPYFTAEPDPQTVTTSKENKSFALKVTSANKSSGGGFKHANSGGGGGGGGGGGCFIAGTLISTNNGFLPIERIQPGDMVLSYNEQIKRNEYSEVLQTMVHYLWTKLHKIYIGNEIIQTTEIHRFYIKRAGLAQWLPASDLHAGDLMYLASGEWQAIDKIEIKKRFRKVYNFEVSYNHNYYVSEIKVLAHNKGGCFIAGTLVTTDQGFKNIENIQIGDIVLSYDEQKKQNVYSQVAQTMIHFVKEPIYTLYIANETLKVTGIHRFFIKRNNNISWIHASDIKVGDLVLFANGTWNEIFKIESKFRFRKVYNFEVSNTHNYYVGNNQILAHNKGRGGGRRAERMRVQKVDAREGQERYYKVTKQLNVLQHAYDNVAKAADRAFGKEKLKNIEREIKAQEKLIQKQKEYTKEINDYVKSDRKRIQGNKKGKTTQKYWSENENKFRKVRTDIEGVTGKEVNFDENGVVTNYNAVIKAINTWYNKQQQKAKKYSEGSKKGERIKEQSEAQRDMMIENLNQYAESVELKLEEDQKLIDMQNELYDQRLEKTNLILKLRIDVADDSLKLIDNLFEQIGDSAFKAANRIALIGKQTEITASKVMGYRQGLLGIFENHGVDGADMLQKYASQQISAEDLLKSLSTDASGNHITEAEIDSMRDMLDGLLEQNTQLLELRKNVIEEIGTVMDENIDRLDRITEKMEYLKDISNSYKNIIDLTGRSYLKISSQVYKSIESANVNLAKKSVEMAKERMDQANEQYNYLVSQYQVVQDELSDQEKDGWQERIKEAQDYVQSMTQDYYSSWEDAIEAVNTKFETSMTLMAEDFSKTMAKNMGSLEALQSRMDLKKEIADVFVPEYEKMYQLSKLVSDAQKAIDESSNVKVRRELQKVQEKILATRQDEQKISQYEIDYLQKELELKKAQLALEEANQVKSQVRMSRDSEGNFSYVYTADEKAVQDAEDEYNAKLYEMQKLNEEYIASLQDQLVSVQQSYIDAMQEAAETYGIGTDEYTKAVEAISKEYNIYFNELTAQMQTSIENQQTTQQVHAEIYKQITNDIYQANVDLTTAWNDTNLAALTGFQSLQEYQEAWKETNSDTLATAIEASEEWGAEMTAIYAAAGQSVSDFSSTVSEETANITQEAQKLAEEMGTALEEVSTNIDSVIDKVVEWEQEHSSAIQKMIEENNALIISLQQLLAEWSGVMNTTGANSLADLEAQIAAAQQAVDEAAAAKSAARETKRRAKDKMRRSNTRQVRKYRKYKTARRKVRELRSKLKRARKGTRKYNKLRKQLRRARTTLKRAKRAVKRTRGGIKGAKKAYNKYTTNVKAYNAAKDNYNTIADTYNDALKKLEDLKTEYDALKNVPIIAGDSKLNPTVSMSETADYLSPTTSTTNTTGEQVSNYVDTMVSALKTALSSVSPTVKIDTLPELKQNVSMEVNFPNVTDPIEAVHETFSSIGTAASLFIGRKN